MERGSKKTEIERIEKKVYGKSKAEHVKKCKWENANKRICTEEYGEKRTTKWTIPMEI